MLTERATQFSKITRTMALPKSSETTPSPALLRFASHRPPSATLENQRAVALSGKEALALSASDSTAAQLDKVGRVQRLLLGAPGGGPDLRTRCERLAARCRSCATAARATPRPSCTAGFCSASAAAPGAAAVRRRGRPYRCVQIREAQRYERCGGRGIRGLRASGGGVARAAAAGIRGRRRRRPDRRAVGPRLAGSLSALECVRGATRRCGTEVGVGGRRAGRRWQRATCATAGRRRTPPSTRRLECALHRGWARVGGLVELGELGAPT